VTRILGLDPSTVATGWAILDLLDGQEQIAASGVWNPTGCDLDQKLVTAHYWLLDRIDQYAPSILGIETPFFKLNAQTMHTLSSLGAAFRLVAALRAVRIIPISPSARCTAVGLGGNADKAQVLYTVNAIFGLALTDHNQSDAIAIAAAAALKLREEVLHAMA
jgi:crossover junction endodeoxyribonuclease RuvC